MNIERFSPAAWKEYSAHAHRIAFGEVMPEGLERIDFALLLVDGKKPLGYVTCRELDSETIRWQFGGAFPGTQGTAVTYRGYQAFVRHAMRDYKRIGTLIENTNVVMLKMALKVGFRVIGVRMFQGSVLLEHVLEFGEVRAG